MKKWTISRQYWFSAAHRVEGHPKCGRMHGHNYLVTVKLFDDALPKDGMLLDYGEMDRVIKPVIEKFDHMVIVSQANLEAGCEYAEVAIRKREACVEFNGNQSTAEEIAQCLHNLVFLALGTFARQQIIVEVQETDKSSAWFEVS